MKTFLRELTKLTFLIFMSLTSLLVLDNWLHLTSWLWLAGFISSMIYDSVFRELSDSERSGQGDKPPFMESNASAQIALPVANVAQRDTATNKSQPESIRLSCSRCVQKNCTLKEGSDDCQQIYAE